MIGGNSHYKDRRVMKKVAVICAAASLLAAVLAQPAQARCRGCDVGLGVIGGIAAGAIIGSAIANSNQPYAAAPPPPAAYVEPAPAYGVPPANYVDGPVCHIERQSVWDGDGYRTRRVRVCD